MFIFYLLNQFLDPYSRRSIAKKLNNGHSQIFCNSWSYFCDYKCHTNIFVFFFPSLYILSTHSKLLYRFISRYKKVFFLFFLFIFLILFYFLKKLGWKVFQDLLFITTFQKLWMEQQQSGLLDLPICLSRKINKGNLFLFLIYFDSNFNLF